MPQEIYLHPKQVAWKAQEDTVRELKTRGAADFFKIEFPDIRHAFSSDLKTVVCIDEGTAHKDVNGELKLCLAGSGILYPATSEEERVAKVAKMFCEMGIDDVTSHGGCGAAGLAYKRDFPDAKPTAQEIEDYSIRWSKKVAEEMGRLGVSAESTHIKAEEMERPPEFHNARVVYFDGIGGFNPNKEVDLPMGFVISRKFVSQEYAAQELKVAVNIVFGNHGFGSLFTTDSPFEVIVFASNENELKQKKQEVVATLGENKNFSDGKIVVDGIIVKKDSKTSNDVK